MGLCNVAIGFQRLFASWLGVDAAEVQLGHAGLNHLTWIRSVHVGGDDVLPRLIEEHGQQLADRVGMPLRLLHSLGAIPSYYLRYFYQHDEVVDEQRNARTRAQEVADIERELLEIYSDPSVDTKPELLTRRGGAFYSEAAVQLLAAVWNDSGDIQVVDVRNNGALPELPDDAIVEVPCAINRSGAVPVDFIGIAQSHRRARRCGRDLRAAGCGGSGHRRPRDSVPRAARPPVDLPDRSLPSSCSTTSSAANAAHLPGFERDRLRSCSPSTAATPRPTSRC